MLFSVLVLVSINNWKFVLYDGLCSFLNQGIKNEVLHVWAVSARLIVFASKVYAWMFRNVLLLWKLMLGEVLSLHQGWHTACAEKNKFVQAIASSCCYWQVKKTYSFQNPVEVLRITLLCKPDLKPRTVKFMKIKKVYILKNIYITY